MLFPEKVNLQTIQEPHLVTIPYSHYCELGRWALEYAGMEFREVKYAPGYHAKMVGELRKDRANRSESSYVGQESGVHGGRRKYAVPLLCLPGGKVLRDSWEILAYALGEPDPTWKHVIDQELGTSVRQVGYFYLLAPETRHHISAMIASASLFERIFWWFTGDKIMGGMTKLMAINEETVREGSERVLRILEEAGKKLKEYEGSLQPDGGFGATEIAFCSLGSICVLPENFGNGAAVMPGIDDFGSEYQEFVRRCRSTAAGEFILRRYESRHESRSSS